MNRITPSPEGRVTPSTEDRVTPSPDSPILQNYARSSPSAPTAIILRGTSIPRFAPPQSPLLRSNTPSPAGLPLSRNARPSPEQKTPKAPTPSIETQITPLDQTFFFQMGDLKKFPIRLQLVTSKERVILDESIQPNDDGSCALTFPGFQNNPVKLDRSKWIISCGGDMRFTYQIPSHELSSEVIITVSQGLYEPIINYETQEYTYEIPLLDITDEDRSNYQAHVCYPYCRWAYQTVDIPKDGDLLLITMLPGSTVHLIENKTNTSVANFNFAKVHQKRTPGIFFAKDKKPSIKLGWLFPACKILINCGGGAKKLKGMHPNKAISVWETTPNRELIKEAFNFSVSELPFNGLLSSTWPLSKDASSLTLKIDGTTLQEIPIPEKCEVFTHTFHLHEMTKKI